MQFRSTLLGAGLLAVTLTAATQASAAPTIQWSATGTGGSYTTLGAGGVFTGGTVNNLTFGITAVSSNSPGTPSIAEVLSTNLSVTNSTGSTQKIYLTFGDTGFTAPGAPPALQFDSHTGGTVVTGSGANTLSFTSYANSSNGQNATSGISSGTGTPAITATGSFKDDEVATINSLGTPYSMTELLVLTLGAGSTINFSDSTTLTPIAVPEPFTLGVLGVGLAGLGLVRRRRAV